MSSVEEVLDKLKKRARPDQLDGMARYRMTVEKRLGVSIPELRLLAKEIQRLDSKAARWIAADAIKELESEAVQKRLKG